NEKMKKLCGLAEAARVIVLAAGLTTGAASALWAQTDPGAEQTTELQLAALQAALQQLGVQLTDLQPVDQPPRFGTFYLASSLSLGWGMGPPCPDNQWTYWDMNSTNVTVYWMGPNANLYGNAYLVDDVAAAAALADQREAEQALSSLAQASDTDSPMGDSPQEGGEGPLGPYSYPSNLL